MTKLVLLTPASLHFDLNCLVILPFLMGPDPRTHAANFSTVSPRETPIPRSCYFLDHLKTVAEGRRLRLDVIVEHRGMSQTYRAMSGRIPLLWK
jgi:hypothetical protein